MKKQIHNKEVDELFDAILTLKTREECYKFFEDVCTVNELLSLSQRLEVAKMLRDRQTYLDISEKTGASTPKDMGKVMGTATKTLAGQADGKVISELVKKLLAL